MARMHTNDRARVRVRVRLRLEGVSRLSYNHTNTVGVMVMHEGGKSAQL